MCCSTVCAHSYSVSPVGEVGKCVISTVAFVLLKAVTRIHVGFVYSVMLDSAIMMYSATLCYQCICSVMLSSHV